MCCMAQYSGVPFVSCITEGACCRSMHLARDEVPNSDTRRKGWMIHTQATCGDALSRQHTATNQMQTRPGGK